MTSSVVQHCASHLARIYVWLAGGVDLALKTGEEDVTALTPGRGQAVDLGAGFGMHSVPLARAGYEVIAIDQSQPLLQTLGEPILSCSAPAFCRARRSASPAGPMSRAKSSASSSDAPMHIGASKRAKVGSTKPAASS